MNIYSLNAVLLILCLGLDLVSADTEGETSPLSRGNCQEGWVDGSFVGMGELAINITLQGTLA